jgi:hypothetical protein
MKHAHQLGPKRHDRGNVMTDLVSVAVVAAVGSCISSVLQIITVNLISRTKKIAEDNAEHVRNTAKTVEQTQTDMVELKLQTNGLTEALVKVTARAEHAKGKLEGIAEEKKAKGTIEDKMEIEGHSV